MAGLSPRADDGAVRTDKHKVRDPGEAVDIVWHLLRVVQDRPADIPLFHHGFCVLRSVAHGHATTSNPLAAYFSRVGSARAGSSLMQYGHQLRPEIYQRVPSRFHER